MCIRYLFTLLLFIILLPVTGQSFFNTEEENIILSSSDNTTAHVTIADIDLDGHPDIVSLEGDRRIVWRKNTDGKGNYGPRIIISDTCYNAQSVFISDVDGDGDPDILVTTKSSVIWYKNTDGSGSFGTAITIYTDETEIPSPVLTTQDPNNIPLAGQGNSVKVTGTLEGVSHQYFATPVWNADNSKILVTRSQSNKREAWIIRDFGNGNYGLPEKLTLDNWFYKMQWDVMRPNRLYYTISDKTIGITYLYFYDVDIMAVGNGGEPLITVNHAPGTIKAHQLAELHYDGEHVLFAPVLDGNGDIFIYSLNNPEQPKYHIPLNKTKHLDSWSNPANGKVYYAGDHFTYYDNPAHTCHRMWFTHHNDLSVMVKDRGQGERVSNSTWVLYPEDSTVTIISNFGGHHTSNPLGMGIAYNEGTQRIAMHVLQRQPDRTWKPVQQIDGISGSCHNHWSPNPERNFIAVDMARASDPISHLRQKLIMVQPDNGYHVAPLCHIDSYYDTQRTHGHASVAWGGHKVAYNSDYGNVRGVPDVYIMDLGTEPAPWPPNEENYSRPATPVLAVSGNIGGDGHQDVVVGFNNKNGYSNGKISWYKNLDGQGNFGPEIVITETLKDIRSFCLADLDGDGDLDILLASTVAGQIMWIENTDGQGTFSAPRVISSEAKGAWFVHAVDLDGDGHLDVLSTSLYDNKIAWYKNTDGQGSFGPEQIITFTANWPRHLTAADIDGDGYIDIISASSGDNKIAWYKNLDGAGSFSSERIISNSVTDARSVHAADITGNGKQDLLYTSDGNKKIGWHRNTLPLSILQNPAYDPEYSHIKEKLSTQLICNQKINMF